MKTIREYWDCLQGLRRRALGIVLLNALAGVFEGFTLLTLIPILNPKIITENHGQKFQLFVDTLGITQENILYFSLVGFLLCGLVSSAIRLFADGIILHLRSLIEERFRFKMTKALFKMQWSSFISMRLGDVSSSFMMESNAAANGARVFLTGVGSLVICVYFFMVVLFISVPMTLATLGFAALAAVGFRVLGRRGYMHSKRVVSAGASIGEQIHEIFGNLKFFRSTGRSPKAEQKSKEIFRRFRQNFFKSHIYTVLMRSLYEVAGILFISGILAYSLFSSKLPLSEAIVFLAIFYRLAPRIMSLQKNFHQAQIESAWYQSWKKRYEMVLSHQEESSLKGEPTFEKGLRVQGLHFTYPNLDREVLKGIDFDLKKGGCIAIVGESGGGKSTLIDLVTGLLKSSEGQVLLDGVPINELSLDAWRSKIGLVLQESPIFHTTLLENIALGGSEPDQEKAKRCAQLAHAWNFIDALPEKMDSVVGEKGARLSVGQKQRIALARALYRNPWMLILDEATSALDGESERIIQESLEDLKGQFAILMVAHRLKTVQMADEILVLAEGKQVERGSWDDLIARPNGTFRKMAELQGLTGPSYAVERV